MTDMKNVVCIYGEEVVGDGWTWYFDADTGDYVTSFEYEGESDGYEAALEGFGVKVRTLRLEEGDSGLDWGDLYEWWDDIKHKPLTTIIASAEESKIGMTWRGGN